MNLEIKKKQKKPNLKKIENGFSTNLNKMILVYFLKLLIVNFLNEMLRSQIKKY